MLDLTKAALSRSDHDLLSRFGEEQKAKLQQDIVDCGMLIDQGDYAAIFERIRDRDAWHLDDVQFVEDFFDRIVRAATRESADDLARAVFDMLPFFGSVSPRAYELVTEKTSVLMNRVIALGRADIAETLLQSIAEGPQAVRDDLLLNPGTAQSIIASGSNNLLSRYVSLVKKIIIPAPNVSGFSRESWAEILNPLHGARISKFLAILGHSRGELREILVQVVGNLYVTGVLIPDDKLFQRDISAYLNSPARENDFLLNYLLLKKFPVYFNEVGATGRIRDDTTEIDSWGNDPILYFLRKQVHVNASNYNIQLIEKIITTWTFNSPEFLEGAVPEDVLTDVNGELLGQYAAVAKPLFTSLGILDNEGLHLDHILDAQEDALRREAARMSGTEEVKAKVLLLCRIYQEVSKKYSFGGHDEQADDPFSTFAGHLETVKRMKSTILSSEKTDPEESLYFKRHIAFGIPSVLGSYHERKFDALGEAFRQETYIRTLMENMITTISRTGERSSGAACKKWVQSLGMVNDLFSLHGLDNFQADELIAVFRANNLHCSQIIDLLRIWQGEMTWMVESLHGMFHHPIVDVLQALPAQDLPDRLKNLDDGEGNFINKAADIVMRDMVSSIAGLTELDRLLDRLITTLTDGMQVASDEQIMFSEGAGKAREYVTLDELHDDDVSRLAPLLGGKAKNLMYLSNRNLPVPPGVVFTADHTPGYREYTAADRFLPVLKKAIGTIEKRSGTRFGNKENPLFLSVRSGSYISMPGILSSILYCGMNRETLAGFISTKNDPWLGWDSYRRFIEHYATVVLDLDITVFEAIAAQVRKGSGKGDGDALSAQELENMVSQYLQEVSRLGADIPDDPYEQLRQSVTAIYRSWYSDRARQFRAAMGVSEHWGTAVTIMQMVSGNAQGSGASVFFTRDPFSHQKGVTGDTGETATGDDLVYGRLTHRRLRRGQAGSPGKSLEEIDPVLFRMHEELGEEVEKAMRGLSQEVEATYTTGPDGKRVISVLQTRRMEFHREFTKKFHDVCRMEENVITRGVGVHGGVLSGVATLSSRPEQIKTLRKENNLPVILLRTTASTDDVSLMPYIDGIVTAAGGPTSHASLLAQKFDLTAVVGCSNMHIGPGTGGQLSARIGDETITEGMLISIDGTTGLVYTGTCFLTVEKPPEEQASRRSVE
ncbi:MAG TPA: hypothetical protein DCO77_00010 [Nitrospiraceae bacterium]|nr:hypothetical protein [Nitrospiraceae bacterium]